jgi:hypothetical protein
MIKNLKKITFAWWFLFAVIIAYIVLAFLHYDIFLLSISYFLNLIIKIVPVFLVIFLLMAFFQYKNIQKALVKHLTDKGFKKWFYAVIAGILSMGPIYMWYPLLADVKKEGVSEGIISTFLYNRAIKVPLLPLAIFYFNVEFVVVLTFVMVAFSLLQGALINLLFGNK